LAKEFKIRECDADEAALLDGSDENGEAGGRSKLSYL
jgi:hypothetical protein